MIKLLNYVIFPVHKPDFYRLEQRLLHKTILITGASYGIGEALCHLLADIECQLILVARTSDKLQSIQMLLSAKKAKIKIFSVDLREPRQLDNLISYLQAFRVDILINNAGISICRPIMQSLDRMHDFERTIKLNYFAPVKLCLALIPRLRQCRGQIINVSAINVLLTPTVNWAAYQASKTAFDQWLRCASAELEKQQIKVSTAYLPLVKTRMIESTKAYRRFPALQPVQAAIIISHLLLTQKRHYKPWWTIIGQIASVIFNGVWFKLNLYYIKRKL
ncbi:SDR family NAD(P)-dependent oxidoreductase [Snodgrassella communis]|uniref:SDR family NAD(P)-dependent oxidoreductase n=1 Tax=Snodgrassella communis TaxID=2946699 RepID=UPI001EF4CC99|nr:SDR family NAD(P)-dependent oxidoreductase [Snodgrassella communis]